MYSNLSLSFKISKAIHCLRNLVQYIKNSLFHKYSLNI